MSQPKQKNKKDMRDGKEQQRRYAHVVRRFIQDKRVYIIRGQSLNVANNILDDNTFDWIYLDSNHFYEHVAKELLAYWPKVKPGGWLCGHDFVNNEWCGVKRAVEEFLKNRGLQLSMLTPLDGLLDESPSWGIQKPGGPA